MAAKLLPAAAFLVPVMLCWINGGNAGVARILIGAGIVFYILSSLLKTWFARRGIAAAPIWVSLLGLIGTGLAPAGIAILLFLSLGLISQR